MTQINGVQWQYVAREAMLIIITINSFVLFIWHLRQPRKTYINLSIKAIIIIKHTQVKITRVSVRSSNNSSYCNFWVLPSDGQWRQTAAPRRQRRVSLLRQATGKDIQVP